MDIGKYLNIRKLWQSKSIKNVMMLTSGTVLSQVLPILFFPILSRLYTPADYGVLGLFMSISMLLMVISNLQLNYAILIPKEDKEALSTLNAGLHIIVLFTVFSLLIVITLGGLISSLLSSPELKLWLYLLPATVLLSGVNIQFSAWFNRTGQFKIISSSRIVTSVVTIAGSLALSYYIDGPGGLVISYLSGNLSSFIILVYSFKKNNTLFILSLDEIKKVVVDHRNFPLYTLPTELISNFAQQLPMFIFSTYSGAQSVGWFSRSRQMLGLPINYISSSISEVYRQKSGEAFRNDITAMRPLYLKTVWSLFVLSIIPFLVIVLFSPVLFAIFFGENWRQAGVYAQYMSLMYFFKFVTGAVGFNFYLFKKQKLDLLLHFLIVIITAVGLYIGLYVLRSETAALILFSTGYSIIYFVYAVISYKLTKI
jgi:O-antigen/teichoic acid export membrane protein